MIKRLAETLGKQMTHFLKWSGISIIIGSVMGVVGALFYHGYIYVVTARDTYPIITLGLPLGGVLIMLIYHITGRDNDRGTNTLIEAVRAEDEVPLVVTPLIMVSTWLTHLFGGSAGRIGAALQIGGSLGNWFGKCFKLDKKDTTMIVMSGMSSSFSIIFGTPLAATFFAMEIASVGNMYYSALLPCVFSSLIAFIVAQKMGVPIERFTISEMPELAAIPILKILVVIILCAGISVLFCIGLNGVARLGKRFIFNGYIRIAVAGICIVVLTCLIGTNLYMGPGLPIIEMSMRGGAGPEVFLVKIVFTVLTMGLGFKGGEIAPSLAIGASFGCWMGILLGLPPSFCAAVGLCAVFCGVINSPITALLFSIELFGMGAAPYFLIAVVTSYVLSGNYGLYQSQRIVYSKIKTELLDIRAKTKP